MSKVPDGFDPEAFSINLRDLVHERIEDYLASRCGDAEVLSHQDEIRALLSEMSRISAKTLHDEADRTGISRDLFNIAIGITSDGVLVNVVRDTKAYPLSAEEFEAAYHHAPVHDDMERINCPHQHEPGHEQCGPCFQCGSPRWWCHHGREPLHHVADVNHDPNPDLH